MVMGASGSKLEKALGDQFPEGERYFGLENFGNTCYCNSVLQVRRGRSESLSARCDASCYPTSEAWGDLLVLFRAGAVRSDACFARSCRGDSARVVLAPKISARFSAWGVFVIVERCR